MAQTSAHADNAGSDATTKTVDVEHKWEDLLDLVLEASSDIVAAHVGDGCKTETRILRDTALQKGKFPERTDGILAGESVCVQSHFEPEEEVVLGGGVLEVLVDDVDAVHHVLHLVGHGDGRDAARANGPREHMRGKNRCAGSKALGWGASAYV